VEARKGTGVGTVDSLHCPTKAVSKSSRPFVPFFVVHLSRAAQTPTHPRKDYHMPTLTPSFAKYLARNLKTVIHETHTPPSELARIACIPEKEIEALLLEQRDTINSQVLRRLGESFGFAGSTLYCANDRLFREKWGNGITSAKAKVTGDPAPTQNPCVLTPDEQTSLQEQINTRPDPPAFHVNATLTDEQFAHHLWGLFLNPLITDDIVLSIRQTARHRAAMAGE